MNMAIKNDEELIKALVLVNVNIQEIHNYLGRPSRLSTPLFRIRFPRGFLRTAKYFRTYLGFISNKDLKNNLSYTLILLDVFYWLINRTDLFGTAKEMVIKNAIVLMASLCESYCVHITKGIIGRKHGFCDRATRMEEKGIINTQVRDELHWLWTVRSGIHIYEINYSELGKYDIKDYNKAISATENLSDALRNYFNSNLAKGRK